MELREFISDINKRLVQEFGKELDGRPKFRIVFSEDQYENRLTEYTDEGFKLLEPEVRLLPKYKQYIREKYILERLIPVPEDSDLLEKMSYEPAWVFQDSKGKYLPPFFDGCRLIIESMYSVMGKKGVFTKYKDPSISVEERAAEIQRVEDQLFGNETIVGDHLAYGTGIIVPGRVQ